MMPRIFLNQLRSQTFATTLLSLFAALVLTGCQNGLHSNSEAAASGQPKIHVNGVAHGGQQAISGGLVQLYAVGTTGDGSTASPLITATVTTSDGTGNATDANANAGNNYNQLPLGNFTITGDYTCPSASTEVYLVITGGNPGLSGTVNNSSAALMTVLGQCGNLTSSTFVNINELTTVASVAPLAPYMTSYSALGSGSADEAAFETNISLVAAYTNTATGSVPGPALPSGYYASSMEITSIANALAPCVNTDGSTATGTACQRLFQDTTPPGGTAPTDTIGAAINIAKYPTNNTCSIFDLASPVPPFGGGLSACPSSTGFTLNIVKSPTAPVFSPVAGTYAGPQAVTITSTPPNAVIYYTTDNSAPVAGSGTTLQYTGPVSVLSSQTLKAYAIQAGGHVASQVSSGVYTINSPCTGCTGVAATPVFSPAAGAFAAAQTVTITSATAGAAIYYTTDGSTPTTASHPYGGSVTVSSTETLSAIAVATNYANSDVMSGQYLIGAFPVLNIFAGVSTYLPPGSYGGSGYVGECGWTGDGGPSTSAAVCSPGDTTVDSRGNIYIADADNNAIRMVTPQGIISTIAGTPNGSNSGVLGGYNGDGIPAIEAELNQPLGVAVDSNGNVYITDTGNQRIRKIDTNGNISTIAGTGYTNPASTTGYYGGYNGDGIPATSAYVNTPEGVAVDSAGNVYIADTGNNRIRKVDANSGIISTVAGTGSYNGVYNSDGTAATSQGIIAASVTVDSSGNLYFGSCNLLLKVDTSGAMHTVAGTGTAGYSGNSGPATSANVTFPLKVAFDSVGNLYFIDSGGETAEYLREVTPAGTISTIAGQASSYTPYFVGNGVLASDSPFWLPFGISIDSQNNVYIPNQGDDLVLKLRYTSNAPQIPAPSFSPFSGTYGQGQQITLTDNQAGAAIYYSTDGSAPATLYTGPITLNSSATVKAIATATGYPSSTVASASYTIEPLTPTPTISPNGGTFTTAQTVTLADTNTAAAIYYTTDGSTPTSASTHYTGTITVSGPETITAIAIAPGDFMSNPAQAVFTLPSNGPAPAPVFSPSGGTYSGSIMVSITDAAPGVSLYYTTNGQTPTPADNLYTGTITVAATETLKAYATGGNYLDSATSSATYTIVPHHTVLNIAGTGTYGYNNGGTGSATAAMTNAPDGVAVDSNGNIFFSDYYNDLVRMVTPSGTISTVMGEPPTQVGPSFNLFYGCLSIYSPSPYLNGPAGIAVDSSNNIYFADSGNNIVRKLTMNGTLPNGTICTGEYAATTIAGGATWTNGTPPAGYTGDNGPATASTLSQPTGVAVDSSGNVYIADTANGVIRMIAATTANGFTAGNIYTVAGLGYSTGPLYGGDGGPATAANFNTPTGVAVDSTGNVYVADFANNCIRVFQVGGNISTFAGTCTTAGYQDGALSGSLMNLPNSVAVDSSGNVYITDENNNVVREAYTTGANAGTIATIAGNGTAGNTGVGTPATNYELNHPNGVAVDQYGNVYIADEANDLIREVTY